MATEQGIQAHDRLLSKVSDDFEQGLTSVTNLIWAELANIGVTQDRLAVQSAVQPLRSYLVAQVGGLDEIVSSIVEINQDVIDAPIDAQTLEAVETLKQQAIADVSAQIDVETNNIISVIVLAGIAGAVATDLIRQTRELLIKARRRISVRWTTSVYEFNTVVTRLRSQQAGVKRYRYVGGTIDTTRDFCRRLNGGVFTEQQIRNLWQSTWSGKSPGDPFVVRGGYNCRHHWIPVADE